METSSFGRYDREIDDPFQYLMEEPIIYKLEAFGDDTQQLQSVRMQLSGMKQTSVTNSVADNIEITASDAQKGLALKKLCAKQGLHPDEVMVFGDSLNDLSMMREISLQFCNGKCRRYHKGSRRLSDIEQCSAWGGPRAGTASGGCF